MPHIVTENCEKCRFTECVVTCPVACFHADKDRLYIDPDECIDCGACIPACPIRAIFDTDDMPDIHEPWIEINAERVSQNPVILTKGDPKPDAMQHKAALGF